MSDLVDWVATEVANTADVLTAVCEKRHQKGTLLFSIASLAASLAAQVELANEVEAQTLMKRAHAVLKELCVNAQLDVVEYMVRHNLTPQMMGEKT